MNYRDFMKDIKGDPYALAAPTLEPELVGAVVGAFCRRHMVDPDSIEGAEFVLDNLHKHSRALADRLYSLSPDELMTALQSASKVFDPLRGLIDSIPKS